MDIRYANAYIQERHAEAEKRRLVRQVRPPSVIHAIRSRILEQLHEVSQRLYQSLHHTSPEPPTNHPNCNTV